MRLYIIILLSICSIPTSAQTISSITGIGLGGYTGNDGPASTAGIGHPGFINFDNKGNLYISELNNTIRKISSYGTIITFAGNGTAGYSGDNGPATNAQFNFIGGGGNACDKLGNLYISDQSNNRIRKINAITGIVTTFAGTGIAGFYGDGGQATSAQLNSPSAITFDEAQNLYILDDFNNRIRKIDTSDIISTFAGNGLPGFSGDGGLATSAKISCSGNIHIRNNELFEADGYRIRKINLTTNIITTVAGTGIQGFSGDGGSATSAQFWLCIDVAEDAFGNLYISDMDNNRIRVINSYGIISTFAGNGTGAFSGDGGPASSAEIFSPRGISLDSCGNLYISDNGNECIRKVTFPECNYLALSEIKDEQQLKIYPNPIDDNLNIDNLKTPSTYQITNLIGSTTQQGTLKEGNNTISLQNLPLGMYMLELIGEDGVKVVRKVVKE